MPNEANRVFAEPARISLGRDLKHQTIMVQSELCVDGVISLSVQNTRLGVKGNPQYSAPEFMSSPFLG